jgi:hypothetical protein
MASAAASWRAFNFAAFDQGRPAFCGFRAAFAIALAGLDLIRGGAGFWERFFMRTIMRPGSGEGDRLRKAPRPQAKEKQKDGGYERILVLLMVNQNRQSIVRCQPSRRRDTLPLNILPRQNWRAV